MKVVEKKIEMIAQFKGDGTIIPIRFRIKEEDSYNVIKIKNIIKVDEQKIAGEKLRAYTCTAVINNLEKIFELRFNINKCEWYLYKI